eukprot:630613-Rhodomonas_salina.1
MSAANALVPRVQTSWRVQIGCRRELERALIRAYKESPPDERTGRPSSQYSGSTARVHECTSLIVSDDPEYHLVRGIGLASTWLRKP